MVRKASRPELSIIIPLYNEEKRFPKSFRKIDGYFESARIKREYLLIDDGSTDKTLVRIKTLSSRAPIKILQNSRNLGKGAALKLGVLASSGKNIFFTDADLSTPIEEFEKLYPLLRSFDLAIGSRRLRASEVKIAQPFHRRFLGNIFYVLFSILFGRKVKDTNCGFKCYRGHVARDLYKKQTNSRWGFDAELIFLAEKFGYTIKEIPVIWLNDPNSRVSNLKASLTTVWELAKIKLNNSFGIYDLDNPEIITKNLYRGLGWTTLFAYIRFWDAPYKELEKLVPKKGKIVDLGCGEGIFANYLALTSPNREIIGVDKDTERLKYAAHGLPNAKFVNGDITKKEVPEADAILLVHVLHHLNSFKEQESLIKKCQSKIKKGGRLIIVEIEPKPTLKYLVTWVTDHFLVPILFERKLYSPAFFRNRREWIRLLRKAGFSCKVAPAEAGKPFTHIILECRKK